MSTFFIYTDAMEVAGAIAVAETSRDRRRRLALREVIENNEQENVMSEEEISQRTRQIRQTTGIPLLDLTNIMIREPVPHGFTEI